MWFLNRSDTNPVVQPQKTARILKLWILKVEELYYPCSENKGADQLSCYRKADLHLCCSHMQIVGFLMRRLIYFHYTLQELPGGYGRMKPDIVTYGSAVRGSALKYV